MMKTMALAIFALLSTGLTAQIFGDFECAGVGSGPACEGWTEGPGFHGIQNAGSVSVPSLPTSGSQFLEIAATGSPATPAYALGSLSPVWPLATGNSHIRMDIMATSDTVAVDYVWTALDNSFGGTSWMEILVLDPMTEAIIATIAIDDSSVATMMPFPHSPSVGFPVPTTTPLTTATATIPAAYVGQTVRIVAVASETQVVFIPPFSFLYVDNFRFESSIAFPGNGGPATLDIRVNNVISNLLVNEHVVTAGVDNLGFSIFSEGNLLPGRGLTLAAEIVFGGAAAFAPAAAILPSPAMATSATAQLDLWLNPAAVTLIVDGTSTPVPIFAPALPSDGSAWVHGDTFVPPSFAGFSAAFQCLVNSQGVYGAFGLTMTDVQIVTFM